MNPNTENVPPSAQDSYGDGKGEMSDEDRDWLRLARASYETSTSYLDTNLRKTWEDSIRAFNNQHAADSKYNHSSYDKRSRLFRPKTRSIIRKNEAAAAAAYFSSMDVTSVSPTDQSNKMEVASAEINKALLQYRLTKTIPWFQTVLGGLQDAQSVGVVCAHVYWDYKAAKTTPRSILKASEGPTDSETEYPEQNNVPKNAFVTMGDAKTAPSAPQPERQTPAAKPISDKPVIDLLPVENLRVDPAANWTNPIESSPFVIHLMPMYMMDVKARMQQGDWNKFGDGALRAACATQYDSTRAARQNSREDPYQSDSKTFSGYEICWIQRHIHRREDEDWEFYTLGDFALLSKPRLLKEVVFHGKRPYVMGCCILEAHKVYPTSVPQLGKELQMEANEVANQRIDNVKFVLNKKWFVKRGKEADIGGLVRNVPGGVVMLDDPEKDVREVTWPDVTASAYEEQSRIDNDMNDLLGNFSVGQVMADSGINGPARNMAMLGQSAGTLVEYLLRTYTETFVQPVLQQLLLLEQAYETDTVVLAIASKHAKLYQKFGIDAITDELLEQELTLTVNVGMGATDPQMKLQKFIAAMQSYLLMLKDAPAGVNMEEVGKEIFGNMGYQDGSRFLTQDNPQMLQMQQQLEKAGQMIQQLQQQVLEKDTAHQVKLKVADDANKTKIITTKMQEDAENLRNVTTHLRAIRESDQARVHELNVNNMGHMHQRTMRDISDVNHVAVPRAMKEGV